MKVGDSQDFNIYGAQDSKIALWGLANQIVNIFVQIILLICASRLLNSRELTTWLILLSFYALITAIPLSFESIVLRILMKAHKEYAPPNLLGVSTEIGILDTSDLQNSDKKIFENAIFTFSKFISVLAAFLYLIVVYVYLQTSHKLDSNGVVVSIFAMCIPIIVLGPSTYYRSQLRSINNGILVSKVQIISRFAIVLFFTILFACNLVLLAFAFGFSIGWLVEMIILRHLTRQKFNDGFDISRNTYWQSLKLVWLKINGAFKGNLIVAFSTFILIRGTPLIAGMTLDDLMLSKFLITQQILSVLSNISAELIRQGAPKLNYLQYQLNRTFLLVFYKRILTFTFFLYTAGSISLVLYSCSSLNSSEVFAVLNGFPLYWLLFAGALELNTVCATSYLATKNLVPHAKSYFISATITIIALFTALPILDINTLIVIPVLIQILYNHWRWPVMVIQDIKSNNL